MGVDNVRIHFVYCWQLRAMGNSLAALVAKEKREVGQLTERGEAPVEQNQCLQAEHVYFLVERLRRAHSSVLVWESDQIADSCDDPTLLCLALAAVRKQHFVFGICESNFV